MAKYRCLICQYIYNEKTEGVPFDDLFPDWTCPVCGAAKAEFELIDEPEPAAPAPSEPVREPKSVDDFRRASDELETSMADIRRMALTGESVIEPMRSRKPSVSWDDVLIKGAQLARLPLNPDETVDAKTVIGPRAAKPLVIGTPIIVSHMSFGALSREAQSALALGSGAMGTAMSSGEGGILEDALGMAHKYIFEVVPNRYSLSPKNLRRVDAIEIKFGQSAKPGMGGHLPGIKVTPEIAAIRGLARRVGHHQPVAVPGHPHARGPQAQGRRAPVALRGASRRDQVRGRGRRGRPRVRPVRRPRLHHHRRPGRSDRGRDQAYQGRDVGPDHLRPRPGPPLPRGPRASRT